MNVLVGVLVALAVVLGAGPAGRRLARVRANHRSPPTPGGRGDDAPAGPGALRLPVRGRSRAFGRRERSRPNPGLLLAQVSTALRSGAPPDRAWHTCHVHADARGVPDPEGLAALGLSAVHVAGTVAAARLAVDLGAPLADVLDRMGAVLAQEDEAAADRASALAGPRATGQVLTWLPAGGVLLGAALGADPVGVLLDGRLGSAALVGGLLLLWAGRRWTDALLARAARAGDG